MTMGYRNCYKRYMASLDYNVSSTAQGGLIVTRMGGKAVDSGEYVSLTTYCYKWKQQYPHLKVSKPAEDICQYCYAFCNRHRYLASHSLFGVCGDGNEDEEEILLNLELDKANAVDDGGAAVNNVTGVGESAEDQPDSAANPVAEEREKLQLDSAEHSKMARTQRALYQEKVVAAVKDAEGGVLHSERTYTFVVDYGQNMELPLYNKEQPGITYYYSVMCVYSLGMVNHAHVYNNGKVSEHMYCHVYHEGVGKKGANNVC